MAHHVPMGLPETYATLKLLWAAGDTSEEAGLASARATSVPLCGREEIPLVDLFDLESANRP